MEVAQGGGPDRGAFRGLDVATVVQSVGCIYGIETNYVSKLGVAQGDVSERIAFGRLRGHGQRPHDCGLW